MVEEFSDKHSVFLRMSSGYHLCDVAPLTLDPPALFGGYQIGGERVYT